MTRKKKVTLGLAVFVLAVIGLRLAAPHFILNYVNQTLAGLDGYTGHVEDVDLHIWRGAYGIDQVEIKKTGPGADQQAPLVSVDRIDISIHWDALLDGSIVGELDLYAPKLNMVAEKQESAAEKKKEEEEAKEAAAGESTWQKQVKELVPLKINRIGIHGGELHYLDPHTEPKVDVYVRNFSGQLENLTNSENLSKDMVATASFHGDAMGSGKLALDGRVDPYKETPTFELDAKLEQLEAKELNDFLRAYAKVDAERGTISVYTEVACADGRFKGYVKPLIKDLRVLEWKKEEERPIRKLWEGIVEAGSELFENDDKQQVATKIPFSGKLEQPQADIGTTVLYVLRNAFVRALQGGIEESIGGKLGSLGGSRGAKADEDERSSDRAERRMARREARKED